MRKAFLGVALSALLALTVTPAATPATAAPPKPSLPVQVDGTKSVTLITGDKVQVSPAGSGRSNVRFFPSNAADSGYETRTVGKDLYVVPDSAARLVTSARWTRRCSTSAV
jgi:hypothetical protein